MKTCTCERVEEKVLMQPGGGQIEFQSWTAVLVLVLQILLRIVACLVGIPVFVLKLCTLDKAREASSNKRSRECQCCAVRCCLLLEEESTSYMNPLFGQDWTSEVYCDEETLLPENMTTPERDDRIVQAAKERQPVSERRKSVVPARAVAKKKPPPKPQRVWR